MIVEIKIRHCLKCDSTNIIRNGHDYKGAQKYHCKDCGVYGTLDRKRTGVEAQREKVMDAYFERVSMRGIARIFGVSRYYLARWLLATAAKLPALAATLVHSPEMCWNLTNCGLLCSKRAKNAGFGWLCVVEPARW